MKFVKIFFQAFCGLLVASGASLDAQESGGGAAMADILRESSARFDKPGGPPDPGIVPITSYKDKDGAPLKISLYTGDPYLVMPFGAGDLSGMLSFGEDELHLHLSKTDFLGYSIDGGVELLSPGHIMVKFSNLKLAGIKSFEQRMCLEDGTVRLSLTTASGEINVAAKGDFKTNTIDIFVKDSRSDKEKTKVVYSNWRLIPEAFNGPNKPEMINASLGASGARTLFKQFTLDGKDKSKVVYYHALALGLNVGGAKPVASGKDAMEYVLDGKAGADFTIMASCVTGSSDVVVKSAIDKLDAALAEPSAARKTRNDAFWRDYWDRSHVNLNGDVMFKNLTRLWFADMYSYAVVGYGPLPPKFNGGPGLVFMDMRCWGKNVWWQNTREMLWHHGASNHPEFAKSLLEFYDGAYEGLFDVVDKSANYPKWLNLPETMRLDCYAFLGQQGVRAQGACPRAIRPGPSWTPSAQSC